MILMILSSLIPLTSNGCVVEDTSVKTMLTLLKGKAMVLITMKTKLLSRLWRLAAVEGARHCCVCLMKGRVD